MLSQKFANLQGKFLMLMYLAAIAFVPLASLAQTPSPKPCFDFTGTGRTSFATTTGNGTGPDINWHILSNGGGAAQDFTFGQGNIEGFFRDGLAPGYYDGDNRADPAVYRIYDGSNFNNIDFYVRPSTLTAGNSSAYYGVRWGAALDRPVIADYDGDGRDDLAVVRNSSGTFVWYILNSNSNTVNAVRFGLASSDIPVNGADYNGDGRAEITVIRITPNQPAAESVYFAGDSATGAIVLSQQWGNSSDVFVIGDYLGDRRADFAVRRKTDSGTPALNSTWYILENGGSGHIVSRVFGYGNGNPDGAFVDYSVCGDYNGDGKQDIAVYRHTDKTFYWLNSPDFNSFSAQQWGQPNGFNYPVANLHAFNDR